MEMVLHPMVGEFFHNNCVTEHTRTDHWLILEISTFANTMAQWFNFGLFYFNKVKHSNRT
jgi:hypothetical protein